MLLIDSYIAIAKMRSICLILFNHGLVFFIYLMDSFDFPNNQNTIRRFI